MTPHSNPVWGVITPHSTLKSWQVCIKYIIFNPFVYSDFNDAASVSKLMILAIAKFYFSDDKIILVIAGFDMAKLF